MNTLDEAIQEIIDNHFRQVAFENYEDDIEKEAADNWDELEFYTE